MIGSEIMRAKTFQKEDSELFTAAIERGINLLDFCFADPKWREDKYSLLVLREELGKFYAGLRTDNIEQLYQTL